MIALVIIWSVSGASRHAEGSSDAHSAHGTVEPGVHLVAPIAGQATPALAPTVIPPAPTTIPTTILTTIPTTVPTSADDQAPLAGSARRGRVAVATPTKAGLSPSVIVDPSVVASAVVPSLPLYSSPGALFPSRTLANPNYLGAPLVLLVAGFQDGWVQAYVPVRPNESTAWIPGADLSITFVPDHIVINLLARQLTLYSDNVPVFQTAVAPGAPSSPTPTGSFFVTYIVQLSDPNDVYGPYALGLSAFSNTYFSFDGGPGQIAIHGTNQPWMIGTSASHGCVRLPNTAITTLAQQVPPGTPVEIGN